MIPAKFDYTKPGSVDEAVRALADGGEDAKVIAGGQSLLPLLRLRLSFPDLLVDVGGLGELRGVRDEGETLWIGALTTIDEAQRDPVLAQHCGLLAQTAALIADPAVRHRGTVGGALAHADPAGDLPGGGDGAGRHDDRPRPRRGEGDRRGRVLPGLSDHRAGTG